MFHCNITCQSANQAYKDFFEYDPFFFEFMCDIQSDLITGAS